VALQRHLDLELFCPMSGLRLKDHTIVPHKMALMQCENGVLFARCTQHVARCFISDFSTVKMVMEHAVVLKVTEKGKRKETVHGKTQ
jgi:hypothetical protein